MNLNPHVIQVAEFLFSSIAAGLVGTLGMTLFMNFLTVKQITNADMVRAIGSMFTKSMDSAFQVGITLHFISGVVFAMIYTLLLNLFEISGGMWALAAIGASFGFMHGIVLSFLLVASVAEYHPVEQFRKAGFGVAAAHLVGHVIYGFLVGLTLGIAGFSML